MNHVLKYIFKGPAEDASRIQSVAKISSLGFRGHCFLDTGYHHITAKKLPWFRSDRICLLGTQGQALASKAHGVAKRMEGRILRKYMV